MAESGQSLKKKRIKVPMFDIPFFVGVLLLLFIGLATLFSAGYAKALYETGNSYYYITRQAIFAVLGIGIMLFVSFFPYQWYNRFIIPFYVVSVVLLVLVLFVGKGTEKRWIYIGSYQFQPSELAKVAVILLISKYIAKHHEKMHKFKDGILIPSLIFGICAGLVLVETHLSGAILIASVGVVLIIAGGANVLQLVPIGLVAVAGATTVFLTNDYMQRRVTTWLNPEADPLGDGFQPLQSLYSIGSGGLTGLGYGKSRQKYLYLPEPQNDFIFSVFCEEMGWICATLVLLIFAFLVIRGFYIASKAPDRFSSLVVVGIVSRLAIQTILNIMVVSNTIPVTGISLPFFSYGGTALVVLLAEMGIVLQISRYAFLEKGGVKSA